MDKAGLALSCTGARVHSARLKIAAEARRAGGEAQGQLFFVEYFFADQIGERNFCRRDEPTPGPASCDVAQKIACVGEYYLVLRAIDVIGNFVESFTSFMKCR